VSATGISIDGYEPAHLSYSSIDGYKTCGKRFELQKVIGVEQRPGLAALGGNAVHTATEWYDLDSVPNATAGELFQKAWNEEVKNRREQSPSYSVEDYVKTGRASAQYGGKRGIEWWMDNGPGMVQAWIDWREASGWHLWELPDGSPAVEVELNIALPGGYPMRMFIDRVMVTPAGQIVVLDIKTGRIPETAEQLGLYAYGLEQEFGWSCRPEWGYFWHPDKGHGSPQSLGMYTGDYLDEQARMAVAGINAGCFMAKPANNCANWCGVAKHCAAVGGTPPDFGFVNK
jgi:hypothetical protein